jgi:RNA polymerase sigma factor FliA
MCAATHKNGYDAATTATGSTSWKGLTQGERLAYIDRYAPLIKYVADRLSSRLPAHIAKDDLISSGTIGLIDAIDKFDPSRNIQFKTYAEFRIKGAMLDELRAMDWVPRSVRKKSSQIEQAYRNLEGELGRPASDDEVAAAMDVPLDEFHRLLQEVRSASILDIEAFRSFGGNRNGVDLYEVLADTETNDALTSLGLNEARVVIAESIESLPEKERLVVTLYYYEELTMKEIGEVLGYTESRISQLHTKALLRMKAKLCRYFEVKTG